MARSSPSTASKATGRPGRPAWDGAGLTSCAFNNASTMPRIAAQMAIAPLGFTARGAATTSLATAPTGSALAGNGSAAAFTSSISMLICRQNSSSVNGGKPCWARNRSMRLRSLCSNFRCCSISRSIDVKGCAFATTVGFGPALKSTSIALIDQRGSFARIQLRRNVRPSFPASS